MTFPGEVFVDESEERLIVIDDQDLRSHSPTP
jgi:hypothetical protein